MDPTLVLATIGLAAGLITNIVIVTRAATRVEVRLDERLASHEKIAHIERAALDEKISSLLAELGRLRDQKHDHTGTVMRHDGAIKDLDRRVGRLERTFDEHVLSVSTTEETS